MTTDNTILSKISSISGMPSRLEYRHFPNLENEVFNAIIENYLFDEIKYKYPNIKEKSQLTAFVNALSSDLRSFA